MEYEGWRMFVLLRIIICYRKYIEDVSIVQGGENEVERRIRRKYLKVGRGYLERGKVLEDREGEGRERIVVW